MRAWLGNALCELVAGLGVLAAIGAIVYTFGPFLMRIL